MNFGEWKTGTPTTSGVYWCQIEKDGNRFGRALTYGPYDYVAIYEEPDEVRARLLPHESYDEDEDTVSGVGWHEDVEQCDSEYGWFTFVYGGDRGEVKKYCELPDPRI